MASDQLQQVKIEIDQHGIALVTLNNPGMRNAITPELSKEMNRVLDRIGEDRSVRVVAITGSGDESFCAGMSLKHFIEYRNKVWELYARGESMMDWWAKIRGLPQPVIAAVNGYCVGGGFCILDACDLAIASERATFSLSEINFGSIPGGGAMRAVLDMMPIKSAMYLILTGRPIDAEAAWRGGLVNKVVPHDRLIPEVMELAGVLAAHPWQTLEFCKKTAYGSKEIASRALGIEYETAMAHFQAHARPPRGGDAQEGLEAFVEKKYKPGVEAYDFRKPKG